MAAKIAVKAAVKGEERKAQERRSVSPAEVEEVSQMIVSNHVYKLIQAYTCRTTAKEFPNTSLRYL